MIAGVGIDIIEVDRVKKSIEKENGFREMIFSQHEIVYCEGKANKYEHYAARFAAKEAFFKALGTGWLNDTAFNEIEIVNNNLGKPEINFLCLSNTTINALNLGNISVSLTHVKATASAIVVIEMA